MNWKPLVMLAGTLAAASTQAADLDPALAIAVEGRHFFEEPAYAPQRDGGISLAVTPELSYRWSEQRSARFVGFVRRDAQDEERSHADIRELAVRQRWGDVSLHAGIDRVFWGVTESLHLVDIINQTDQVENPDGEDKLGQPMLDLAWQSPVGTFAVFVLPYFRERTLPGPEGRLRAPLPYDQDHAIYESGAEEKHVDGALRWSLSRGPVELGLSHFSGTARTPRFVPRIVMMGPTPVPVALTPVYDLVEQSGLDLNVVSSDWSWKLESIRQRNRVEDFSAAAGGVEYTFSGVAGSAWDVGLLTEYLWDSRRDDAPTPFQDDVFLATRLAANDEAGLEILAGVVVDAGEGGVFGSLEASRRLGDAGKLALEWRVFADAGATDPLGLFAQDDYLALEYSHHF
jgi:hypothetical protein